MAKENYFTKMVIFLTVIFRMDSKKKYNFNNFYIIFKTYFFTLVNKK